MKPLVSLRRKIQSWRERRALERRAIPEALWNLTLARFPFLAHRSVDDVAELRRLSSLFLDSKEFTGAQGMVITDDIAMAVAAQACLPVLKLGLDRYAGFIGIVIHRGEVVARREMEDEDGVVHQFDETLSGEAMLGGPMMLSWPDVAHAGESAEWAYNVVIHEFAHILDMNDGIADGIPPLPDRASQDAWADVIGSEFDAFCAEIEAGVDTLIDPYGAQSVEEFFAVGCEAFFVKPVELQRERPRLYRLLANYFQQDPAVSVSLLVHKKSRPAQ